MVAARQGSLPKTARMSLVIKQNRILCMSCTWATGFGHHTALPVSPKYGIELLD